MALPLAGPDGPPRRAPIAGLPLLRDAEEDAALTVAAWLVAMSADRDQRRAAAAAPAAIPFSASASVTADLASA